MSNQTSQKYYLINLSTRNVSISTHLRSENFTLGSGKCIYLGNLTDEQIVKYHRYSALNVSLRIMTQDKAQQILNKSINATENMKESILNDKPRRVEHEAGSIGSTSFSVSDHKHSKLFSNPKIQERIKQAQLKQMESVIVDDQKQESVVEKKAEEPVVQPVVEKEESAKQEMSGGDMVEVAEDNGKELASEKMEQPVEAKRETEMQTEDDEDDESEGKRVDGDTVDESLLPKQIDVVEENAKLELEKMSYSDLLDLAKASNITFKKKPSKQKLIDALAAAQK